MASIRLEVSPHLLLEHFVGVAQRVDEDKAHALEHELKEFDEVPVSDLLELDHFVVGCGYVGEAVKDDLVVLVNVSIHQLDYLLSVNQHVDHVVSLLAAHLVSELVVLYIFLGLLSFLQVLSLRIHNGQNFFDILESHVNQLD